SADFTVIAFKKPETASVSGFSFSSWILQSAQATYLKYLSGSPITHRSFIFVKVSSMCIQTTPKVPRVKKDHD
ncbi:MAG: hypothetical protein ACOX67_06075, partial [Oscillospiraceae bacterium]